METGSPSNTRPPEGEARLHATTAPATGWLALAATAGVAFFAVTVLALHVLHPGNDRAISNYAVGPYGALMTAAFLALGAASWALLLGLRRALAPAARSRVGFVLLGAWATGVLLSAVFPTDPPGVPQTATGAAHELIGLAAFICALIASLRLSYMLRKDLRWRSFSPIALASALAALAAFVFLFLVNAVDGLGGWFGVAQRLFVATVVVWLLLMGIRVRSVAARGQEGDQGPTATVEP